MTFLPIVFLSYVLTVFRAKMRKMHLKTCSICVYLSKFNLSTFFFLTRCRRKKFSFLILHFLDSFLKYEFCATNVSECAGNYKIYCSDFYFWFLLRGLKIAPHPFWIFFTVKHAKRSLYVDFWGPLTSHCVVVNFAKMTFLKMGFLN